MDDIWKKLSKKLPDVKNAKTRYKEDLDLTTLMPTNYPELTSSKNKEYENKIKGLAHRKVNDINREALEESFSGMSEEEIVDAIRTRYQVPEYASANLVPDLKSWDNQKLNGVTYYPPERIGEITPQIPQVEVDADDPKRNATFAHEMKHLGNWLQPKKETVEQSIERTFKGPLTPMEGVSNVDKAREALVNRDFKSLYDSVTGKHFVGDTIPEDAAYFQNLKKKLSK